MKPNYTLMQQSLILLLEEEKMLNTFREDLFAQVCGKLKGRKQILFASLTCCLLFTSYM
jgi:hypothetical protein